MIVSDIVASHSLRRTSEGYGVDRIFIVTDVTGPSVSRLYNASIASGIPQYGDPHPTIPDIQVTDVSASPESSDSETVKIRVSYSAPDEEDDTTSETELDSGVPVVTAGLVSEDTNFDANGDFIIVRVFVSLTGQSRFNYEKVSVQRPQMRVTLTRTEPELPKARIAEYLGSVNGQPWSGFRAKTWLISSIDVTKEKTEWEVQYSFIYKPNSWRAVVVIGIPPADIDEHPPDRVNGNGFGIFDVYPEKDFNLLGLSF